MDKYSNYAKLREKEREGIDFRICITDRAASAALIAPHGGKIERGTSEIAAAIAEDFFSLYCFEGLRSRLNRNLHITSTNFDEPRCQHLIAMHDVVVSVHGPRGAHEAVDVGGLDFELRDAICQELKNAGFAARIVREGSHAAVSKMNMCNRGRRRIGVQLELTEGLRNALLQESETSQLPIFAQAIRAAIFSCIGSAKSTAN